MARLMSREISAGHAFPVAVVELRIGSVDL